MVVDEHCSWLRSSAVTTERHMPTPSSPVGIRISSTLYRATNFFTLLMFVSAALRQHSSSSRR